jgi:hypothetical protein
MAGKVTVRLVGGLGNQLHCFAFGRAISINNGAILEIDTGSGYWNDPYGRQFLLERFPNAHIKNSCVPISSYDKLVFRVKIKLLSGLSWMIPLQIRPVICEKKPMHYQESVHKTKYKNSPYFIGYWAAYRYYQNIADELRKELTPPRPEDPAAVDMLKEIKSVRSCAIHWRSYKEEVSLSHKSLSIYYKYAVKELKSKYPDICFYVFSDDLSAARLELCSFDKNMTFVNIPLSTGNVQSLIDFYLMYSCDHAIIGDSTFSWWAAWLSDREGKTIIAPRGLSRFGDDWIPLHWKSVTI